jgi:hypothetical protein
MRGQVVVQWMVEVNTKLELCKEKKSKEKEKERKAIRT